MTAVSPLNLDDIDAKSHVRIAQAVAAKAVAFAEQHATAEVSLAFGPAAIGITICGRALSSVALGPLRHAATDQTRSVDLHLIMVDGKDSGVGGPTVRAMGLMQMIANNTGDPINAKRPILTVNEEWNVLSVTEPDNSRIVVWFADAAAVPEWVVYDQIRNALHWLSHECSFGMFHAAALQLGSVGCLITGKSGSGKSTITAAAVASGLSSAGDDFVLIETAPIPRVHAVFDTLKIDEKGLTDFPQFRPFIRNPDRRHEDKAIVHLYDSARDRIATGFPLHAILHARLTGKLQSRIVPSTASAAFLALAPSTLLLLRTQSAQVSKKCAAIVGQLNSHAFEIGTDLRAAVTELAIFFRHWERS